MADIRALVITHGALGAELVRVTELVLGPVPGLEALSNQDSSAADLGAAVRERMDSAVSAGAGLLVFVDDRGGSCATAARLVCGPDGGVPVISGVNLAMLLGFASWRETLDVEELAHRVLEKGREAITRVGGA